MKSLFGVTNTMIKIGVTLLNIYGATMYFDYDLEEM